MPTTDYLPVAVGGGANVDSQGNFNGSGYQLQGFTAGTAQSAQANKIWRQSSMIAAAVANLIMNELGINVNDDGNLPNLITNLTKAVMKGSDLPVAVAINSGSPVFDCSLGNVFDLLLTQNCPTPTITNFSAGQRITIILRENGTGGFTFTPPAALPMADIVTTANAVNVQEFVVRQDATVIYARTPLVTTP